MVSKKNGNAEGGRPKRKRRSGSGGGGDDLAILRARCEKLQAKLDRLEAKHKEAIAANKEKIKKIREKAREKRQRRRDEKVRQRGKQPKSARRGRRTLTYRQIDERYIARGRAIPMKADAAWESELEEMNRGKRGRPFAYADGLIETIGTFRLIIDTPYRQCEGAAVNMLGRENTPHFTTLCRRLNRMAIVPGKDPATASVVDGSREIRLAIDGSGLIPSTRGEWIRHVWKVKRGFIRLSILVDVDTKMVLAFAITDESVGESPRLPTLLDEALEKLGMPGRVGTSQVVVTLMGDKAYDSRENFSHCRKRGVAAGIPVKVNANCRADGVDRARTEAVLDQLGGGEGATPSRVAALPEEERRANQKDWKRRTSQGARWAVEGVFSSFKRILGEAVRAVKWPYIIREVANKINVYNWMQQISGEAARAV